MADCQINNLFVVFNGHALPINFNVMHNLSYIHYYSLLAILYLHTHPAAAARSLVSDLADRRAVGPLRASVEGVRYRHRRDLLGRQRRLFHLPEAHLIADHVKVDSLEALVHASLPCRLQRVDLIYDVLRLE